MKKKDKDTCPWWPANERPAKLQFWLRDGFTFRDSDDIVRSGDLEISIGRTDSRRGLGFAMTKRESHFTLTRRQVDELIAFLTFQVRRLQGKRAPKMSLLMQIARRMTSAECKARRKRQPR